MVSEPAVNHKDINQNVEYQHRETQQLCGFSAKTGWVDQRDDVVIDKSARVVGRFCQFAQALLHWRQRTDAVGKTNPCAPGCRWDVRPCHPRPKKCKQAARHHENDEAEMNQDQKVGGQLVGHTLC